MFWQVASSSAFGLATVFACRFASSWYRHSYGANELGPVCPSCVVCAASASERPRVPSQPPYRLSKLWFSS